MRVNEPSPFFNGPQVLGSECQVLKDSMSFILKGPKVLEAECKVLKDSMSFIYARF
jgi:hypothetical protein